MEIFLFCQNSAKFTSRVASPMQSYPTAFSLQVSRNSSLICIHFSIIDPGGGRQCGVKFQMHNPLSPDMKMCILLTVLLTVFMELVRRICLNIKTSHPW